MFLFTKRTKKVIKWFWGVFAVLVILSMVFTYSGFTMLAGTGAPRTNEIPPEVLAELQAQQEAASSTPSEIVLTEEGATGTEPAVQFNTPVIERTSEPETPPVPPLQFEL